LPEGALARGERKIIMSAENLTEGKGKGKGNGQKEK